MAAAAAPIWATVPAQRTVLFVVHNTVTLNRIMDVIGVFEADFRIQCLVTSELSDPFVDGLTDQVAALGLPTLPWEQALRLEFDLVISASHHGDLAGLRGPLAVLPHGSGFNKYAPGEGGTAGRSVFGLGPDWVLRDGRPFAAALVMSHPEQRALLAEVAPAALPAAVVAGDPCFDRMLASRSWRQAYRAALGVADGRRLVAVSSTWSGRSLLGARPGLVADLLAELPADGYQVVLIAHPNVWSWHGPFQLRAWLADCLRAGLIIVPPLEGWQQAVLAADCVIGDHGSVTAYAAALGTPVLLGAFPEDEVVPRSPAEGVGRLAPRLVPGSLREQVDAALAAAPQWRQAGVAERVTAVPGEAAGRLRSLFYRLLRLPEPRAAATPRALPVRGLAPAEPARAGAWLVRAEPDPAGGSVRLERFSARLREATGADILIAHHADPDPGWSAAAEVRYGLAEELPEQGADLLEPGADLPGHGAGLPEYDADLPEYGADLPGHGAGLPGQHGDAAGWLAAVLREHPQCRTAALLTRRGCLVRDRDGWLLELIGAGARAGGRAGDRTRDQAAEPGREQESLLLAVPAAAWSRAGIGPGELGPEFELRAGPRAVRVLVRVLVAGRPGFSPELPLPTTAACQA